MAIHEFHPVYFVFHLCVWKGCVTECIQVDDTSVNVFLYPFILNESNHMFDHSNHIESNLISYIMFSDVYIYFVIVIKILQKICIR
jgi:hypothetical protein